MPLPTTLLDELGWRGLVHQYTEGLPEWLTQAAPVSAYCGFDPTAPSLHVGSLVPVMGLVHLQRTGHRPIALVGGGTGLIGDPSGKTSERHLHTPDVVEANARAIESQLRHFLDFDGAGKAAAKMLDNGVWLRWLNAIDFMRDIGKHFRVNAMLQKEAVRARLESEMGISYTEFSYMLLQAYDFLELHRREGVTLQIGGSDQWGNITAGTDLVGRVAGRAAHGLTLPLVTTATGTKFGKTEAGTVWLDAARTSPYKFFQFWINTDDRDAGTYLRYFSLMPREEVEGREAELVEHPERREAQRALAREVTERVHGAEAARIAEEVSGLLFGGVEPGELSAAAFSALADEVPFTQVPPPQSGAFDTAELFAAAKLAKSKGEARRLLEQGGLYLNGRRLTAEERTVPIDGLLAGHLLLRKGGREYCLVRVER
ncbi:MAG: tyrosine--tRNA ligase [Gemmatimonadota bacterium]|nr:tyrosine--tRNA ligase [Gemmatimonadota bacterium]